ncbi:MULTISPECIES: hypothetical protein [unclassified Streptomyces]|uniref:hypothetical protein n=1 Tax=unclassified Streptomyces TaxID=2593676 RepID=UPI002ED6469E|nr:hypothetical protein OH827_16945 [Streptomyces sp. NBC_00891]WSY06598.1 hypothetical protein OG464_16945 [Streptomyces sp. NBC_00890]WSZ08222.1 hypothetical protein OG704_16945 [Streptomyces sp. NBC_00869]WSZ24279.1 hypothetical protein OG498_16620 [Streptomyces sp. NBC_00870]
MSVSVGRAGAGLRLLRAAVFAAVCVALSAAGHALAACATVPWWSLLAAFAGVLAVAVPLAGRERSLPSIAVALAGGQLALHTLFGIGTHTTATASAATGGEDTLIRFAASLVCGAGPHQLNAADARHIVGTAGIDPATVTAQAHQHLATAPAGGMSGFSGTLPSLSMLLGHLLAALATGWLLRRGEVALFRLARLSAHGAQQVAAGARLRALRDAFRLVAALRAGLPGGRTTGPLIPRTAVDAPRPATGDPLQHMVIRRGPPSALALAA